MNINNKNILKSKSNIHKDKNKNGVNIRFPLFVLGNWFRYIQMSIIHHTWFRNTRVFVLENFGGVMNSVIYIIYARLCRHWIFQFCIWSSSSCWILIVKFFVESFSSWRRWIVRFFIGSSRVMPSTPAYQ